MHFLRAFQKYIFRSVALFTKKLWAILDFFFTDRTFFRPVPYPVNKKIKILTKNLTVILSKIRVLGQTPNAPPPLSLFRVKGIGR